MSKTQTLTKPTTEEEEKINLILKGIEAVKEMDKILETSLQKKKNETLRNNKT